jgi:hypothetical protein
MGPLSQPAFDLITDHSWQASGTLNSSFVPIQEHLIKEATTGMSCCIRPDHSVRDTYTLIYIRRCIGPLEPIGHGSTLTTSRNLNTILPNRTGTGYHRSCQHDSPPHKVVASIDAPQAQFERFYLGKKEDIFKTKIVPLNGRCLASSLVNGCPLNL